MSTSTLNMIPSKPVFVTDVDGVLLDIDTLIEMYFLLRHKWVIGKDRRHWDLEHELGVPKETIDPLWDWLWAQEARPHMGAAGFLEELRKDGFEIVALTNRKTKEAQAGSIRDLTREFPGLIDRVVFADKRTIGSKGYVMRNWAAPYFLDDNLGNIYSVKKYSPGTRLFLMDRPWNQSQDIAPPFIRARSYDTILNEVRRG